MSQQNKFPKSAYSFFFTSLFMHWVLMFCSGHFGLKQQPLSFTSLIQPSRGNTGSHLRRPAASQVVSYHGSSLFGWTLPLGLTRPQMAPWFQHRAERSLLQWKCGTVRCWGKRGLNLSSDVLFTFNMVGAPKIWRWGDCLSLCSWKQT